MKINLKYFIPIMLLACLNISLLSNFFGETSTEKTEIKIGLFPNNTIARSSNFNKPDIHKHIKDSIEFETLMVN